MSGHICGGTAPRHRSPSPHVARQSLSRPPTHRLGRGSSGVVCVSASPGTDPAAELYQAVKLGRRAVGIELKPSYWRTAVENLTELEAEMSAPSLFDAEVLA